jgi:hypothetical protein
MSNAHAATTAVREEKLATKACQRVIIIPDVRRALHASNRGIWPKESQTAAGLRSDAVRQGGGIFVMQL